MTREVPEGAEVRYFHLKPEGSNPGATLAFVVTKEGREYHGWAAVSTQDQFSRPRGRQISLGRALKKIEQKGMRV